MFESLYSDQSKPGLSRSGFFVFATPAAMGGSSLQGPERGKSLVDAGQGKAVSASRLATFTTADLARQLAVLESGMHGDKLHTELTELEALCVFNLLLAARLNVPELPVPDDIQTILFQPVEFAGLTVPRFVQEVENALGPGYFARTRTAAKAHLTLQQYVLEFVVFCCQQHFGALEALPNYLLELLGQPVEWEFPAGPQLVPRALSVALATSLTDPAHPLSRDKLVRGTEYVSSLAWFTRWMAPRLKGFEVPTWLRDELDAPAKTITNARAFGISQLVEGLYWSTGEARESFDLSTPGGRLDLISWFARWIAPQLKGYRHPGWVVDALTELSGSNELAQVTLALASGASTVETAEPIVFDDGVNIVGWARAEIGIGEDVRQAALALGSIGLPFSIIDATDVSPPASRQDDFTAQPHIVTERRYGVDLAFLDASTQFRYYAGLRLRGGEAPRAIVGVCPWELPRWPEGAAFAIANLDRFWAASRYIADAFAPYFSSECISLAPPAVVLPDADRDELVPLVPQGPLRFLTIFDGLSSIHRKNPSAVIRAFRQAFPRSSDVRLTVKYMNLDAANPLLDDMRGAMSGDQRIDAIGATMRRSELLALIRDCHCFVSLHRAEGFGRNIAESMLLGRPVICSRYSGNLDFCTASNAYLVDGDLIAVQPGEYFLADGQMWFDASIEHAAAQMRLVRDGWEQARRVAALGRDHIRNFHSAEAAGQRYRDLLRGLVEC